MPMLAAKRAQTSPGDVPCAARSASVTAPWRLASRDPSGASTSGTCAYLGNWQVEQAMQHDLAGCRCQQVVSADHLGHPLGGVVDDYCQVVRGHAVVALQHDVVDPAAVGSAESVDERLVATVTEQAQRRFAACLSERLAIAIG